MKVTTETEESYICNAVKLCEIAMLKQQEPSDLAKIYKCVKEETTLKNECLRIGSPELKRWHDLIPNMRIRMDDILEVRLTYNGRDKWIVCCPQSIRETVIWQTPSLIHSGVRKTVARLRLSWIWPGLTSEVM